METTSKYALHKVIFKQKDERATQLTHESFDFEKGDFIHECLLNETLANAHNMHSHQYGTRYYLIESSENDVEPAAAPITAEPTAEPK